MEKRKLDKIMYELSLNQIRAQSWNTNKFSLNLKYDKNGNPNNYCIAFQWFKDSKTFFTAAKIRI